MRSQLPLENQEVTGKDVTIIVPAYNEENGIGSVLEKLGEVMAKTGSRHEILVVDDGSEDGTAEVAEQHETVTMLRHSGNRGYGAALKTGIRHAGMK